MFDWARGDHWERAWDDLIAVRGREFGDGTVHVAADPVELSAVRCYLEPLEMDCPLHYDVEVARAHGYPNVVAPYSGLATWTSVGLWRSGDPPLWTDPARNAQPNVYPLAFPAPAPATNSLFQSNLEHVFIRPIFVGDHLATTGQRFLECIPKQTAVGRGAFITWEIQVLDHTSELVALMRPTAFFHVAWAELGGGGSDE